VILYHKSELLFKQAGSLNLVKGHLYYRSSPVIWYVVSFRQFRTDRPNALEPCEILLVVGTPTLSPETVSRLARTLYHQDPEPITEGSHHDGHRWIYDDRRVDNLACYLTSAELTQCAHRHRPLRYDGRMTISICESDIDYLPVTETIVQMPRLTEDGEDRQQIKAQEDRAKLDQARRLFEVQGISLGVHRLARAAHVATDTASRYLRVLRQQIQPHTHTHICDFNHT
jgi:hypothetical protein